MKIRVLLVEDNQDMRSNLRAFFSEGGYSVTAVGSAEDAIDEVDEKLFDIALIDINLPGKSGFSLIEHIRQQGHVYPVIAMTARDAIVDKIKGFDLGLTDYIVKPFDLLELRARVQAHTKMGSGRIIKTDNYQLNLDSFEFTANEKRVVFTVLELKMLEILMRNNHALVTIDDLIEHAWGEQPGLTSPPLRIHIANIRKKINDTSFQKIRTISGIGYIFNDPISKDS
jgi:DNA-binding response OmpR family regulator